MINPPQFPQPLQRERTGDPRTKEIARTGSSTPHLRDGPAGAAEGFRTSAEELLPRVNSALQKRGFYVLGVHELERIWCGVTSGPGRHQLLRAFALRAGGELQSGWTHSTAMLRLGPAAHMER